MKDYAELVNLLRDDNSAISIKTMHDAADAIEELSDWWKMFGALSEMVNQSPDNERLERVEKRLRVLDDQVCILTEKYFDLRKGKPKRRAVPDGNGGFYIEEVET